MEIRVDDSVYEQSVRVQSKYGFRTTTEMIETLIRDADGKVSGLGDAVFGAAVTDARVGGWISSALAHLGRNDTQAATEVLRLAQRVMVEAAIARRDSIAQTTAERVHIRKGSNDWS